MDIEDSTLASEIVKAVADLTIQSMMFDMDIDWETLSLIQKKPKIEEPFWLRKWKEKMHGADRQPRDYEGGDDGRR